MAGCNTAVSNIVMSCVLLLTLLVITPLFKYTPNAVIASIIISAVIGLIDIKAMILIWKIDKLDFIACMGAFFGVVFVSVEIGLLIAVREKENSFCFVRFGLLIFLFANHVLMQPGWDFFCQNPAASDEAADCSTGEASED